MLSEVENCVTIANSILDRLLLVDLHNSLVFENNRVLNGNQLLFSYRGIHGSGCFLFLIWRGKDLDDSAHIKARLAVFRNTLAAMWGYATRDANVMIRTT